MTMKMMMTTATTMTMVVERKDKKVVRQWCL